MLTWLNALLSAVGFIYDEYGAFGCFFVGLLAFLLLAALFWFMDNYTLYDLWTMGS